MTEREQNDEQSEREQNDEQSEPVPGGLQDALERFRAEHGEEVYEERFRRAAGAVWHDALGTAPPAVRAQLEELAALPDTALRFADDRRWREREGAVDLHGPREHLHHPRPLRPPDARQ
jgi:hypothetical protein